MGGGWGGCGEVWMWGRQDEYLECFLCCAHFLLPFMNFFFIHILIAKILRVHTSA